jgi:hypothetical protein
VITEAHDALLARLREIIKETPKSGALNAAEQPYYPTRFEAAVERRSGDGARLVDYMREKIHQAPTDGYDALIAAGRPDLTAEAVVADAGAPWASFDRIASREPASARWRRLPLPRRSGGVNDALRGHRATGHERVRR